MNKARFAVAVLVLALCAGASSAAGESISWQPDEPVACQQVTFSFDPPASDVTETVVRWDFGDGSNPATTTATTVTHTYSSDGTYSVEVTTTRGVEVLTYTRSVEISPGDPDSPC